MHLFCPLRPYTTRFNCLCSLWNKNCTKLQLPCLRCLPCPETICCSASNCPVNALLYSGLAIIYFPSPQLSNLFKSKIATTYPVPITIHCPITTSRLVYSSPNWLVKFLLRNLLL